jgi:hypothetical protein
MMLQIKRHTGYPVERHAIKSRALLLNIQGLAKRCDVFKCRALRSLAFLSTILLTMSEFCHRRVLTH